MKFIRFFWSDVRRAYPSERIAKVVLKILTNPSLHAAFLVRACQFSVPSLFWIWRRLLMTLHGMDVGRGVSIGESLSLPHPVGIVIGGGSVIGDRVSIFQNVTIGSANGEYPTVEDDVVIYPGALVVGNVVIKKGRKIRGLSFVYEGSKL